MLDRAQRKALMLTLGLSLGALLLWRWGRSVVSPATAEEAERQRLLDNIARELPPTVKLVEEKE